MLFVQQLDQAVHSVSVISYILYLFFNHCQKMKLLLYPHGGSGNHGCEAIVRSTLKMIPTATLFSSNPDEDKKSLLLMAVASCFSTWIVRLFSRQHSLPGFTAPFIFSVWILLGICTWITPDLLLVSETVSDTVREVDYVQAFCLGIGQVMFQENLLTGLFFLAGIGVNSWTGTFYTALGTLLPVLFAVFWGIDPEMLNMGLMGYNGVLCALALGGKTWKSFVWALCSVLLSVVLQFAGIKLGITTLTAPFVLSVWMIMIMQKVVNTKGE